MYQSRKSKYLYRAGVAGLVLAGALLAFAAILIFNSFASGGGTGISVVDHMLHPTPKPVVTCRTPQHTFGNTTLSITSAGQPRSFLVHLPNSYGVQAQPLVINYHGYNMTPASMEQKTNMDSESNNAGFVLVYPLAEDSPPSWDAGVGAYGPTGDADDIQFTRDLLSYLETNYCVDAHRVYLTGFSLGGGMVYRLACNLTDQIAAIATVSGAYYPLPEGCPATRPIPVLEIHGNADHNAPYAGNPDLRMAAVQDYLSGWLARDKCDQTSTTIYQKGDTTGTEWSHCASGVVVQHYAISDGIHTWPVIPGTPYAIDANKIIWSFFSKYTYPPATPTPVPTHKT